MPAKPFAIKPTQLNGPMISIKVSPDMYTRIAALAHKYNVSQSEVVRQMIEYALENQQEDQ